MANHVLTVANRVYSVANRDVANRDCGESRYYQHQISPGISTCPTADGMQDRLARQKITGRRQHGQAGILLFQPLQSAIQL